ncbi:hypothetical protein, variant 1 [Batrachochytrium dendrobatidis JEL423]|uniref:Longin domain-containing protein n=1 Tax=Batrachochytrium dendrobatidis (strain JEL423) TaxID=403673 RepID=A0A177WKP3_BATDL|nr:hypothetical protein, variant 1 [Batrachochytrium dendrobatidis JEL423]
MIGTVHLTHHSTLISLQPDDPITDVKKLIKPLLKILSCFNSSSGNAYSSGHVPNGKRSSLVASLLGASSSELMLQKLPLECSLDADPFVFHYLVDNGVIFMCIVENTMPRLLAFSYLLELVHEFIENTKNNEKQWREASRPYSLIRLEPIIQSIKARYRNPRALQSRTDLVDLSMRVRAIPTISTANLFPTEFAAASRMTLQRVAGNVSNAAEQFSTGHGYSENTRSWRTRYLVTVTLLIFFVDLIYGLGSSLSLLKIIRHRRHPIEEGVKFVYAHFFMLIIFALCPVLTYQMRKFQQRQKLAPLAIRITLAHAFVTFFQILHTLLIPNDLPEWHNSADHSNMSPLQQAAVFFSTFSIPAPLVFTKVIYLITVWLVVGSGVRTTSMKYDKLDHLE